jgi:hypothetical protein
MKNNMVYSQGSSSITRATSAFQKNPQEPVARADRPAPHSSHAAAYAIAVRREKSVVRDLKDFVYVLIIHSVLCTEVKSRIDAPKHQQCY